MDINFRLGKGIGRLTKQVVVGFLAMVFLLLPMQVFAAPYHRYSWRYPWFSVSVDGAPFKVWGYEGVKLQDVALILSGTTAQFDIAEPPYGWDFWIRRGEAYIPDGTELWRPPIENSWMNVWSGFSDGYYPRPYHMFFSPKRNIVIGFDGNNYPAITITILITYVGDYIFFSLRDLSFWLGFELTATMWENWRGADYAISTGRHNAPTPSRFIRHDTFPVGTRQRIDYAYALRVRTGAGNDYDVLTFVHRGDEFEILDYSGRFVQIYTNRGAGWIFAGFISREKLNSSCY